MSLIANGTATGNVAWAWFAFFIIPVILVVLKLDIFHSLPYRFLGRTAGIQ